MPYLRLQVFLNENDMTKSKEIAKQNDLKWRPMLETWAFLGIASQIGFDDGAKKIRHKRKHSEKPF